MAVDIKNIPKPQSPKGSGNTCPGSFAFSWQGISSDMVICPVCGWYTHWENRREHLDTAKAAQDEMEKFAMEQHERFRREHPECF